MLESLGWAVAPVLRELGGERVGEDLFLAGFDAIEDRLRDRFGAGLGDVVSRGSCRCRLGPIRTAWTLTPRGASSPRSDCVRLKAAAFDTAYAGVTGNGASAIIETLLTSAPPASSSAGRNACVTP